MEVEELCTALVSFPVLKMKGTFTFMVPSSVLAITTRFRESLAKPVTVRSFRFVVAAAPTRPFTPSGAGPTLRDLRLIPDCMLYMLITPVEEAAMPKFPQAETQTAWDT